MGPLFVPQLLEHQLDNVWPIYFGRLHSCTGLLDPPLVSLSAEVCISYLRDAFVIEQTNRAERSIPPLVPIFNQLEMCPAPLLWVIIKNNLPQIQINQ